MFSAHSAATGSRSGSSQLDHHSLHLEPATSAVYQWNQPGIQGTYRALSFPSYMNKALKQGPYTYHSLCISYTIIKRNFCQCGAVLGPFSGHICICHTHLCNKLLRPSQLQTLVTFRAPQCIVVLEAKHSTDSIKS